MADTTSARQQVAEKIKDASTVLVTVGKSPSVDELSAALGLTIMLNKLNKHATAVVSGDIPPAIEFLEPGKTFENTVDSLRDFIIALDKEKADHLRYKVEGDVVKIFITPYRTKISEKDLEFTQGDYNVELVLALGVSNQDDLDAALESHGKILHDATVVTISTGETSTLGSIDWSEANASSISEMLVSLSEAIKNDKVVLDEQVATAFLTGIVAATDRFSNPKTSSKVMTMAAQLMAAGANQQLIAAKLQEAHEISGTPPNDDENNKEDKKQPSAKVDKTKKPKKAASEDEAEKPEDASVVEAVAVPEPDGSLAISHEREGSLDEVAQDVARDNQASAAEKAEDALASQLKSVTGAEANKLSVADLQKDIAASSIDLDKTAGDLSRSPEKAVPTYEPTLGGTLSATTELAAADKRREEEKDQNRAILSHGAPISSDSKPIFDSPLNSSQQADDGAGKPELPPLPNDDTLKTVHAAPVAAPKPQTGPIGLPPLPTLEDIDTQNRDNDHSDAMADVHAAFGSGPAPADLPSANSAPDGLPPLPDFSVPPPPPVPTGVAPAVPAPVRPNAPEHLNSLPPAQNPEQLGQIFGNTPAAPVDTPPAKSNDPAQFKIPGQQ